MFIKSSVIVLALCALGIESQLLFDQRCQKVQPVKQFDLSRFCGEWYVYEGYLGASDVGATCITSTYNIRLDGSIQLVVTQKINGKIQKKIGYGKVLKGGYIQITFPKQTVVFAVLAIDYANYVTLYSCKNVGRQSEREVWHLTRTPFPTTAMVSKVHDIFKRNDICLESFTQVCHNNC